jgi:hypothetical protein
MGHIKMKNILAENMRRFGTKNLNEQQLDLFKFNRDKEYFMDRPELFGDGTSTDYETLATDMKMAITHKEGKKAIQVAEKLLKYITVGVYEKLQSVKDDPKYGPSTERLIQGEIDKIQTVNQDVINDAIKVLKVSPQNMPAMQTIYDIIIDLVRYVD